MKKMKAMILAAGRGERMRPLTDTTPKPLLKVGNDPLIVWHIKHLKQAGISEIVINHAWLGKQIEQYLGNGSAFGVQIEYSDEGGKGFETAGGIATALDLLGKNPFLVINGDVLTDIDFQAACERAKTISTQKTAHIWLVQNPEHNLKGDFGLLENGLVSPTSDVGQSLTFSGIGIYSPDLFENLPKREPIKLAPILREQMQNNRVSGEFHAGMWLDVGTVERLQTANDWAKQIQGL